MAKPKAPKKTTDVKEAVSNPQPMSTQPMSTAAAAAAPAMEPASKPAKARTKKPEIVRSEPRANLVPINMDDEIRQLAYLRSERRGFAPGHETDDWLAAEHEVLERYQQHSA